MRLAGTNSDLGEGAARAAEHVERGANLPTFDVVFTFYQRDPAYSLALASLSAYAKRELPELRVHLVPIFRDDTPAKIVELVRPHRPILIAVSAMSPTWLPSLPFLDALKAALPETPILVGGYQAIVSPEETIRHPAVDYVCVGDGEEALLGLIRRLRDATAGSTEDLPGLWEKRADGEVVRRPPALVKDLDALPFPDYSIFERDGDIRYLSPVAVQSRRLNTVPVVSGRGCPYRCTYCANTTLLDLHGGKGGILRKHDPEVFVEGLARLRDRYGVEYFQFWDEEFLYDARHVRRLLSLYAARVGLPYSLFARPENMDEELCRLAAGTGCHSMWFGIESGSASYRREYLGRRMSNQSLRDAAATAGRLGIRRFCFAMVGMPFESRANVDETLHLLREVRPELTVIGQFLPLPGTPLYELCRRQGLLLDPAVEQQMWPLGRLNIREHPGGLTAAEMQDVAAEVMAYLEAHNRFDA